MDQTVLTAAAERERVRVGWEVLATHSGVMNLVNEV